MRQNTFHHTIPDQKRASTGIAGLDAILGRGLPSNSEHELTIREFRLGKQGIKVGSALVDFEGVLTGVASYKGALPLLGDADAAGRP